VTNGTTTFSGSKSGTPGIIDSQDDVGGWPALEEKVREADYDTDKDGMPNEWEIENGLNPNDPEDRNEDPNKDGYTNLEVYLNNLVSDNDLPVSVHTLNHPEHIKCYPNPAHHNLFVDLGSVGDSTVKIYSLLGKKVFQKKLEQGIQEINCEDFLPGIYLVQVFTITNEIFSEKIIIR